MTHATKTRTGTLDDIAPDSHVFSIIAMDQRNTLRRMFTAVGFDASDDDLRTAKADVARVLTPAASGLLSDPTYGVPAITQAGALAPAAGCSSPPSPPSGALTRASPAPTATRPWTPNGSWIRAVTPSSSSSSYAPTARPPAPASRTWSPRRWPSAKRSSATAAPRVSRW